MSANVKFQDLSISNFDHQISVEGIKGGTISFSCGPLGCGYRLNLPLVFSNLAQRIRQSLGGCCPTTCTPVDWCGR